MPVEFENGLKGAVLAPGGGGGGTWLWTWLHVNLDFDERTHLYDRIFSRISNPLHEFHEVFVASITQNELQTFFLFFFYIHNLKIYNSTKHIYINDIIGSMIGMATLNDL